MQREASSVSMLRRILVLGAVFGILLFLLLLVRLYKIQIVDYEYYKSLALGQQLRKTDTSAERGTIYDRNMNVLAVSASVDNVFLSPAEIELYGEDKELIARNLSEILGLDYDDILNKEAQTLSWYVTLARKVDRETADAVRAFKNAYNIRGVRLETDTKRYYPNSYLACHLIGFVGTDNYGLEGIEACYDDYLSGSRGQSVRATNAMGTELLFTELEEYEPGEDGMSVVTSIDTAVQYYVEKHLRQAVADYDIRNGAGAIVMDVNTGAILAMASLGNYDLNNFLAISDEAQAIVDASADKDAALAEQQIKQWRSKALSDTYEPGSTFKIITLAMALDSGAVSAGDSFYCPGSVNVVGRTSAIRCWKDGGHGSQTLTQAVQHSCNVAFVNIGQRIGAERFYEYLDAFGFLELSENDDAQLTAKTGIDLSGESGSIFWSKNVFCNKKNLSQLAAASFGQTFTITPLQLITAVSACVNGGRLMQPYVVEKLLNPDGSVAFERKHEPVRQVISEQTSAEVRRILEQVVGDDTEGTGRNAAVTGYRIGGKTGTSEKVSLEAATGTKEYIVSFIGVAPADEPRIAILVFLDTPSNETGIYISGGQMAAPTVGAMLSDILPYLGVEPTYSEKDLQHMDVTVPELEALTLHEAAEKIKEASLRYRTIGEGDYVTAQLPREGLSIAAGTEMILYLGAEPSEELECMPDIVGMSYEQARDTLAYYGLYIQTMSPVSGSGNEIISSQSIEAGTRLDHGSVVSVRLVSSDESLLGRY